MTGNVIPTDLTEYHNDGCEKKQSSQSIYLMDHDLGYKISLGYV